MPVNSESKGKQSLKELSGSAEVSTVNHQNKSDSDKVVKKNENHKSDIVVSEDFALAETFLH